MLSKEYQIVIYGLALLVVPHLIANVLFPIRDADRALIGKVIPILVGVGITLFGYLWTISAVSRRGGLILTGYWMGMSLLFDLMIHFYHPVKISWIKYLKHFGKGYILSMVVMGGFVYFMNRWYRNWVKRWS